MTAEHGPGWRVETAAGVTTFFTMAYIVVVNPAILAAPGTGMSFGVASEMGINAFFAYTMEHGGWG